jgi:hypothetical protein
MSVCFICAYMLWLNSVLELTLAIVRLIDQWNFHLPPPHIISCHTSLPNTAYMLSFKYILLYISKSRKKNSLCSHDIIMFVNVVVSVMCHTHTFPHSSLNSTIFLLDILSHFCVSVICCNSFKMINHHHSILE